jgi:hypothetical protein
MQLVHLLQSYRSFSDEIKFGTKTKFYYKNMLLKIKQAFFDAIVLKISIQNILQRNFSKKFKIDRDRGYMCSPST